MNNTTMTYNGLKFLRIAIVLVTLLAATGCGDDEPGASGPVVIGLDTGVPKTFRPSPTAARPAIPAPPT